MKSSRRAKYSRNLHTAKMRITFHPSPLAKRIILAVIIITMLLIIGLVAYSFIFTKENQTKWQITQISEDYYENYYYPNLIEANQTTDEVHNYLEKHHENGLAIVTLNVLLSYDNQKNAAYQNFLDSNCDRNATFVKFYPDPPYDKNSYHIEYTYSCNYE